MASAAKGVDSQGTDNADEKLVRVLQETAAFKLLEKLDLLLPQLTREAVNEAIIHAMHTEGAAMPKRVVADEPRSWSPKTSESRKPKEGGLCEAVWKELDKLRSKGTIPTLAAIQKVAKHKRWNSNNVRIEYYEWRKAHGIRGRLATEGGSSPIHA